MMNEDDMVSVGHKKGPSEDKMIMEMAKMMHRNDKR
jgi:hypothetical protein